MTYKKKNSRRKKRKYVQRTSKSRNFDDPRYRALRRNILKRDGYKCQWPNCIWTKYKLHVHHIKTWSEYPTLRFIERNCITLCSRHHRSIWGKEEYYEVMFNTIIKKKILDKLKELAKDS